jgi:dipeptidyl aminopeptidase/acylaminoacyl peptidase
MRLASPITHIHPQAPPFLIVHGTRDETVPFDQGERFHHALTAAGISSTFVPIEGGFHNLRDTPDIAYASPVWDRVGDLAIDFFNQTLQPHP